MKNLEGCSGEVEYLSVQPVSMGDQSGQAGTGQGDQDGE